MNRSDCISDQFGCRLLVGTISCHGKLFRRLNEASENKSTLLALSSGFNSIDATLITIISVSDSSLLIGDVIYR